MKIGIITFHRAISYGAVLQAFALKKFLTDNGFEAEIIDYRNKYFEKLYYSKKIDLSRYEQFKDSFGIKKKARRILEIPYLHVLRRGFLDFQRDYLDVDTQGEGSIQMSDSGYDYYITGSDQVWNIRLTDNDMTYLLDFAEPRKRISFSASIGGYPIERDGEIIRLLKNFRAISVREATTKEKLEGAGIRNVCINLDPVFLLYEQDWRKLASSGKKKGYVLLFEVGRNKKLLDYALGYARSVHKKLYYLSTYLIRTLHKGTHNLYVESPQDFLTWVMNADYVFTNSFHGTAFSIIFHKKFYCHILENQRSCDRMIGILNGFGLEEFCDPDKIGYVTSYDLTGAISENREKALKYIRGNTEGDV